MSAKLTRIACQVSHTFDLNIICQNFFCNIFFSHRLLLFFGSLREATTGCKFSSRITFRVILLTFKYTKNFYFFNPLHAGLFLIGFSCRTVLNFHWVLKSSMIFAFLFIWAKYIFTSVLCLLYLYMWCLSTILLLYFK